MAGNIFFECSCNLEMTDYIFFECSCNLEMSDNIFFECSSNLEMAGNILFEKECSHIPGYRMLLKQLYIPTLVGSEL
jgi:hypothetical protein